MWRAAPTRPSARRAARTSWPATARRPRSTSRRFTKAGSGRATTRPAESERWRGEAYAGARTLPWFSEIEPAADVAPRRVFHKLGMHLTGGSRAGCPGGVPADSEPAHAPHPRFDLSLADPERHVAGRLWRRHGSALRRRSARGRGPLHDAEGRTARHAQSRAGARRGLYGRRLRRRAGADLRFSGAGARRGRILR